MADLSLTAFALNAIQILVVGGVLLSTSFLIYLTQIYKFWERKGIKGPKPTFLLGSLKDALFLKCTEAEAVTAISTKYKNEKYIGIYHLWKPVLLVLDLELAKKMFENDFEYFTDHPDITGTSKNDAPLDSLFTMHGQVWKSRRTYFTKLFTPKKLKEYSTGMQIGLRDLLKRLNNFVEKDEDVETIDLLEPFAVYSIAEAMYGLNLTDDKERSQFLLTLTHFFMHPPADCVLKFLCYSLYPKLFKMINLKTLPIFHWECSTKLIDELTYTRDNHAMDRNDCLTLVMNLMRNGSSEIPKIQYEEAVGHVFSFLQAGTHTTQTTACHVLLRLAEHPEVQEKVANEVYTIMKGAEEVTYDHIREMVYLDDVILETQRICPLLGTLKRTCTKDYKIDDNLILKKGMDVFVDAKHIHMDPKYFPEPHVFKPERWTTGEAEPSGFMGFGRGPRTCIGRRFAEVEIKMIIASIVRRYKILPSKKMKPLKFDPKTLFISNIPVDGIWLKFTPRHQQENSLF